MSPDFEIINYQRFRPSLVAASRIELLHSGMRWAEGPVYFADGDYLLFSDIPNNCILRWVEGGGVTTYRYPSHFSNGNTRDRQGRLVTCESGSRRITRTEYDGTITTLVDSYEGKRLNSPNDLVVRSDDTIWFTDPPYGILSNYTGDKSESELGANNVFCFDPGTGELNIATGAMVKPNGLAFSPDEKILYVADTGISHQQDGPHHIMAWEVDGKRLKNPRVFADIDPGVSDGFRVDTEGQVWTSAGDGIHCYAPDGELIGKIRFPEVVSNLTFGGRKGSRLFVTTASCLYSVFVGPSGAQLP
ncbi:SMP-30/gluconolactonase/LRE family protein [Pollutimonas bauzanensis]|uniref:Gluconolactonase n=1 Tax=Pollutimonas bauzanensis TaxID=658167 RepID=A0A1M5R2L8_9BURK|nr:SMP-30/gluconolactonase/LRE family protein [Pollutimonas bauzanensis]SHH20604.1 gluconolactonase [Pollutimonas bauzanensis]